MAQIKIVGCAVWRRGGPMLFVQYQGPTTGGRPIYDGRFNMTERKAVEEERTDI